MRNILLVTRSVPEFDTNAGDWRVFLLCRFLTAYGNVFVLPLRPGRTKRYADALKRAGVNVLPSATGRAPDIRRLIGAYQFDIAVFEWYYVAALFARFFPLFRKVVIDTHELHFLKNQRMSQVEKRGAALFREQKRNELDVYRLADTLVTVTGRERGIIEKHLPRKKVLAIPTGAEIPSPYGRFPAFEERRDLCFFAFFDHRQNSDAARSFVRSTWPLIQEKLPGVSLHLLGHGAGELRFGEARDVVTRGRIPDISKELCRYRVSVCPLRFGAGMKKKIVDALGAGTPVVSTLVGAEGMGLRNGCDILIARGPRSFAKAVVKIYNNRNLWDHVSLQGYSTAENLYSIDAMHRSFETLAAEIIP